MVGEKLFQTNLLSRLSHKVCRLLSSSVLLSKFTTIICMDPHSPNKLFPTKYCFLILGDEFLFLNHFFIFRLFFFFVILCYFVIIVLLLFFRVPECSGMFRNVPEWSMFRNVPCSWFYRRPERTVFGFVRVSSFVHNKKGRKITKVETSIK